MQNPHQSWLISVDPTQPASTQSRGNKSRGNMNNNSKSTLQLNGLNRKLYRLSASSLDCEHWNIN